MSRWPKCRKWVTTEGKHQSLFNQLPNHAAGWRVNILRRFRYWYRSRLCFVHVGDDTTFVHCVTVVSCARMSLAGVHSCLPFHFFDNRQFTDVVLLISSLHFNLGPLLLLLPTSSVSILSLSVFPFSVDVFVSHTSVSPLSVDVCPSHVSLSSVSRCVSFTRQSLFSQ